jgi:hypothetical protein
MWFPMNRSCRALILVTLLTASARAQSLGEFARAERARSKNAAVKSKSDEDVGRTQAADCDRQCEVSVRKTIETVSKVKITDAEWQARFSAGVRQLRNDDEWQTIYPLVKQECERADGHLRNSPSTRGLFERLALKVARETDETLHIISDGLKSPGGATREHDYAKELDIKTVKLGIISLKVDQLKQQCQDLSE